MMIASLRAGEEEEMAEEATRGDYVEAFATSAKLVITEPTAGECIVRIPATCGSELREAASSSATRQPGG